MQWLQKLPNSRPSPAGLEWRILRKLPVVLLASTLIPLACYLVAWLYPETFGGDSPQKYLTGIGIAAIATVVTAWTAVFTVAIGCTVVVLMKGPAYVADRYDLVVSERPAKRDRDEH